MTETLLNGTLIIKLNQHDFGSFYRISSKKPKHDALSQRKLNIIINEPVHDISNNVVFAINKASDQPAHTRSLIRAFACRLNVL